MSNEKIIDFVITQSRVIADFAMDLSPNEDPLEAREHMVTLLASIANALAGEYLGEPDGVQLLADAVALVRPQTND